MECCNNINEYRYNSVNNTNTPYHYPYGYHASNAMRYQHAANYRNSMTANGSGMGYDRYNSSCNYNAQYGYSSNSTNQYYPHSYSSHESYKYMNSTNYLQQSYHHRELYNDNEQAMYRSRHGYMTRDQSYHHYADFQLNNSSTASRADYLPNHSVSNGTSMDLANTNQHPHHHYYHYHHNTHHHQYHHNGFSNAPYNDYSPYPSSGSSYCNNGYMSSHSASSSGENNLM